MTNLLKVSAAALFFAVGLTSCESKPAATETSTTSTTTESAAPMAADSAAGATTAPADGTMAPAATDTTKAKM